MDARPALAKLLTELTVTPDSTNIPSASLSDITTSPNSLFDEVVPHPPPSLPNRIGHGASTLPPIGIARRTAPIIPGLFFNPAIHIPSELAADVLQQCMTSYFTANNVNQVMLFGRAHHPGGSSDGLPVFLRSLLNDLEALLQPLLPVETHRLLFPPPSEPVRARQAIINLYRPGEGISPHVDLLRRFGDGILGVSLGSGCVMGFRRAREAPEGAPGGGDPEQAEEQRWHVYLPEKSVLVLSGDARYKWTHGIEGRVSDLVESEVLGKEPEWLARDVRLSITFRWLLPGAEVVGGME